MMDWYVLSLKDSTTPQWLDASVEFPILLTSASILFQVLDASNLFHYSRHRWLTIHHKQRIVL